MTPAFLYPLVVKPTLEWLGAPYNTPEAALMLLTVPGPESSYYFRGSLKGEEIGLWRLTVDDCRTIMTRWGHKAIDLAFAFSVGVVSKQEHALGGYAGLEQALRNMDTAGCAFARGHMWLAAHKMPNIGDRDAAFEYYKNCWKRNPIDQHPFKKAYKEALKALEQHGVLS